MGPVQIAYEMWKLQPKLEYSLLQLDPCRLLMNFLVVSKAQEDALIEWRKQANNAMFHLIRETRRM
jgi:hypothetical protein